MKIVVKVAPATATEISRSRSVGSPRSREQGSGSSATTVRGRSKERQTRKGQTCKESKRCKRINNWSKRRKRPVPGQLVGLFGRPVHEGESFPLAVVLSLSLSLCLSENRGGLFPLPLVVVPGCQLSSRSPPRPDEPRTCRASKPAWIDRYYCSCYNCILP